MEVRAAAIALAQALDGGWAEFMTGQLAHLEAHLADAAFSDAVFTLLPSLTATVTTLQLVGDRTRVLIAGKLTAGAGSTSPQPAPASADIHVVATTVQRIRNDQAAARNHPAIRSILTLVQTYRNQKESYERFVAHAPPERAELLRQRFEVDSAQIMEAIRHSFATYLAEHPDEAIKLDANLPFAPHDDPARFIRCLDTKEVRAALTTLNRILNAIRATMNDIQALHSGKRAPLVRLAVRVAACTAEVDRFAVACHVAVQQAGASVGITARTAQRQLAIAVARSLSDASFGAESEPPHQ